MAATKDWSATQYLKFHKERTRPSRDLLAQLSLSKPPTRIVDLGCGPGNSTAVLVEAFPSSTVVGMDSSLDMIEKARSALPGIEFTLADLNTYQPPAEHPIDLFFSNAVLQWLPSAYRISVVRRLLETQRPGGVFAFQVPDNFHEPSHVAMRTVAENGSWADELRRLKPARDPFASPQEIYNLLAPVAASVDIWHTYYQHVLDSHEAIVEWVKGTGLRPFIDPLPQDQREEFLRRFLDQLRTDYPVSQDGKVLLRYPRLFVVAVRR